MSGYNHVTLVGVLVTDPEIENIGKKTKAIYQIGVDRYCGKDKKSEVDFFNIVSWGKLAEITNEYLEKGKRVLVDGRIQVRSSEEDGKRRWITEVVAENIKFLSPKQQ